MQIFNPIHSTFSTSNVLLLLGGVVGFVIYWIMSRREVPYEQRNQKNMLSMLSAMFGFIMLASGVFGLIAAQKLSTVSIDTSGVMVGTEKLSFQAIDNAYIKLDQKIMPLSPNLVQDTTKVLVIEKANGDFWQFSETDYDVEAMLKAMQVATGR